ncbi:unnamed protein product [Moneuplotes crassus]|uniref:Uncharacterized protein n=1 Tax=Euplotes crassus TaxID=5936 RepID=A0AAD1XXJ9_EUPCR|nr:unnamed protein product [Moneuplotes crassus]
MLSNPWGLENEGYIHDVGMLDQVISMQAELDSNKKYLSETDKDLDFEKLASYKVTFSPVPDSTEYLSILEKILDLSIENSNLSLSKEKLMEGLDSFQDFTCQSSIQAKTKNLNYIISVLSLINEHKSDFLKILLKYRTSYENTLVISKPVQEKFINLLQKLALDSGASCFKELSVGNKALSPTDLAMIEGEKEFEEIQEVYESVQRVI